jgi:hypothetical protein
VACPSPCRHAVIAVPGGPRRRRPVRGVRRARADRRRARRSGSQSGARLAGGDDGERGGRGNCRRQRWLRSWAPLRATSGGQPDAAQPPGTPGPGPAVPGSPGAVRRCSWAGSWPSSEPSCRPQPEPPRCAIPGDPRRRPRRCRRRRYSADRVAGPQPSSGVPGHPPGRPMNRPMESAESPAAAPPSGSSRRRWWGRRCRGRPRGPRCRRRRSVSR